MNAKIIPLSELTQNKQAKIIHIQGGHGLQRKLAVMGIKEQQIIKIISRQPLRGPITIQIRGTHLTMGRGMAQKIQVEVM